MNCNYASSSPTRTCIISSSVNRQYSTPILRYSPSKNACLILTMLLCATCPSISFSTSPYSFLSFLDIIMPGTCLQLYTTHWVLPCTSVPRVICSCSCSTPEVLFDVVTETSGEATAFARFEKAFGIGTPRDMINWWIVLVWLLAFCIRADFIGTIGAVSLRSSILCGRGCLANTFSIAFPLESMCGGIIACGGGIICHSKRRAHFKCPHKIRNPPVRIWNPGNRYQEIEVGFRETKLSHQDWNTVPSFELQLSTFTLEAKLDIFQAPSRWSPRFIASCPAVISFSTNLRLCTFNAHWKYAPASLSSTTSPKPAVQRARFWASPSASRVESKGCPNWSHR